MTERRMSMSSFEDLPEDARTAWTRLRDELLAILGHELVAIWGYGSVIGADRPRRRADLDTHVILERRPDAPTARRIDRVFEAIAVEAGVEWDAWCIVLDDARQSDHPPHAYRAGRRDTAWALHRAQWLAGRCIQVYGREPAEVVRRPTSSEIEADLDRELEHIERHVLEGDRGPYEAAYAILNGSRILHSIETHNVVLSKREAGTWALENLPERWHPAVGAALRVYDEQASGADVELLASDMADFVATVRQRLPASDESRRDARPRWSGY